MGVAVVVGGARYWHLLCREDRDPNDIEDVENMLEWHAMQVCVCLSVYTLHVHLVRLKTCYLKYNN